MKYPAYYHGKETLIYYTVTLWPAAGGCGSTIKTVYKTASGAEKRAIKELKSGFYKEATIRKEKVYFRDDNNEFSSSGFYKNVTK